MRNILQLDYKEAKDYFLKEKNYFTLDLPDYYHFNDVINTACKLLNSKNLCDLCTKDFDNKNIYPSNYDNVNYSIFNNKKSRYQWRRLELIHPVLYVDLVNTITQKENWTLIKKKFTDFSTLNNIKCCSIPIVSSQKRSIISNWWRGFEQESISQSIDFSYMGITDIENCYSSIYTHTIPWALHTKDYSKEHKKDPILGNIIDIKIRNMQYGQTNGIPQGSVLMDFIAEMVLGYADYLLSQSLCDDTIIENYKIIRYRDDYHIFANDVSVIKEIIKQLSVVLAELNMSLNASKTRISDNLLLDSLKEDKVYKLDHIIDSDSSLQQQLMSIYKIGVLYPNCGNLKKELSEIEKNHFREMKKRPNGYEQLISIITEIMYRNTSTYPYCVALISKLLSFLKYDVKARYINRILNKFSKEPFCDYLELWLQRITVVDDIFHEYNSDLCNKVYDDGVLLWNSDWLQYTFDESSIVNKDTIEQLNPSISSDEMTWGMGDYAL